MRVIQLLAFLARTGRVRARRSRRVRSCRRRTCASRATPSALPPARSSTGGSGLTFQTRSTSWPRMQAAAFSCSSRRATAFLARRSPSAMASSAATRHRSWPPSAFWLSRLTAAPVTGSSSAPFAPTRRAAPALSPASSPATPASTRPSPRSPRSFSRATRPLPFPSLSPAPSLPTSCSPATSRTSSGATPSASHSSRPASPTAASPRAKTAPACCSPTATPQATLEATMVPIPAKAARWLQRPYTTRRWRCPTARRTTSAVELVAPFRMLTSSQTMSRTRTATQEKAVRVQTFPMRRCSVWPENCPPQPHISTLSHNPHDHARDIFCRFVCVFLFGLPNGACQPLL
eukprot:m.304536 g.304536  ORF g.304536 m.304536 type:complete len:347 (+) comp17002_c0_seq1:226-1266(+)